MGRGAGGFRGHEPDIVHGGGRQGGLELGERLDELAGVEASDAHTATIWGGTKLERMQEAGYGRIVNIASEAGRVAANSLLRVGYWERRRVLELQPEHGTAGSPVAPAQQIRAGNKLTQRALQVQVGLLGQTLGGVLRVKQDGEHHDPPGER